VIEMLITEVPLLMNICRSIAMDHSPASDPARHLYQADNESDS
jgi:hypothetical protein